MHGKNRVKNPVTRHHLFKITLHHPFLKFGSSFARVSRKCNLELDVKLFSIVMNRYFKKKKRKKRDVNYTRLREKRRQDLINFQVNSVVASWIKPGVFGLD